MREIVVNLLVSESVLLNRAKTRRTVMVSLDLYRSSSSRRYLRQSIIGHFQEEADTVVVDRPLLLERGLCGLVESIHLGAHSFGCETSDVWGVGKGRGGVIWTPGKGTVPLLEGFIRGGLASVDFLRGGVTVWALQGVL